MKKLLTVCCVCKKEIPDSHPRLGGLNKKPVCMGCEGVEIKDPKTKKTRIVIDRGFLK